MATLANPPPRASRTPPRLPLAKSVHFTSVYMSVVLHDGRELSVPLAWFAELAAATHEQRCAFEIVDGGADIVWPAFGSVSVRSLLAADGRNCASPRQK